MHEKEKRKRDTFDWVSAFCRSEPTQWGCWVVTCTCLYTVIVVRWLDLYLGVVKGHWKNSLKIGHVTNTYIGGMYAFTMNSHDPKGLMRL